MQSSSSCGLPATGSGASLLVVAAVVSVSGLILLCLGHRHRPVALIVVTMALAVLFAGRSDAAAPCETTATAVSAAAFDVTIVHQDVAGTQAVTIDCIPGFSESVCGGSIGPGETQHRRSRTIQLSYFLSVPEGEAKNVDFTVVPSAPGSTSCVTSREFDSSAHSHSDTRLNWTCTLTAADTLTITAAHEFYVPPVPYEVTVANTLTDTDVSLGCFVYNPFCPSTVAAGQVVHVAGFGIEFRIEWSSAALGALPPFDVVASDPSVTDCSPPEVHVGASPAPNDSYATFTCYAHAADTITIVPVVHPPPSTTSTSTSTSTSTTGP